MTDQPDAGPTHLTGRIAVMMASAAGGSAAIGILGTLPSVARSGLLALLLCVLYAWLTRTTPATAAPRPIPRATAPGVEWLLAALTVGAIAFAFSELPRPLLQRTWPGDVGLPATLVEAAIVALLVGGATWWFGFSALKARDAARDRASRLPGRTEALAALVVAGAVLAGLPSLQIERVALMEVDEQQHDAFTHLAYEQLEALTAAALPARASAGSRAALADALAKRGPAMAALAQAVNRRASPERRAAAGRRIANLRTTRLAFDAALRSDAPNPVATRAYADYRAALEELITTARSDGDALAAAHLAHQRSLARITPLLTCFIVIGLFLPSLRLSRARAGSLQRMSNIVARGTNAMLLTDDALRITWINPALQALTGYAEAMALGAPLSSLFDLRETACAQALATAERERAATRWRGDCRFADGSARHCALDVRPLRDPDGQDGGFWVLVTDLTATRLAELEQARARAALTESEEKYRRLVEDAYDLTIATDMQGVFTYFSPSIERFGYTRDELVGTCVLDVVHPDDRAGFLARRGDAIETGKPSPQEHRTYRVRRKDGSWAWIESSPTLMYDTEGTLVGVSGHVRDVTDRQETTLALRQSLGLLDSMSRASGAGGWQYDPRTHTGSWTPQMHRIFETDPGFEPTWEGGFQFFPGDAGPLLERTLLDALDARGTWDIELPAVTAKDRAIWVRATGHAEVDGKGAPQLVGSFVDITAAHTAREALRAAHEETKAALATLSSYHAALDQSGLVVIYDAEGHIDFANDAACQALGRTRDELRGMYFEQLLAPDTPALLAEEARRAIAAKGAWHGETHHLRKDGSDLWTESTLVAVADADGRPHRVIVISYDVTDRKKLAALQALAIRVRDGVTEVQAAYIAGDNDLAFARALDTCVAVSESAFGFVAEVLYDDAAQPFIRCRAVTDIAWDDESARLHSMHREGKLEFHNLDSLYGTALRSRQPVFSADAGTDPRRGGVPPGHPYMRALMCVPILLNGEMLAMVGLANRPGPYDADLLREMAPLCDAIGQIVRSQRERAARAAAEAELEDQKARLENVIQATGVGTWTLEIQTGRVWCNDRWSQLLGYPLDEMQHWNSVSFFSLYHPDDVWSMLAFTERTFTQGENTIDLEVRMKHRDGHWVWIHQRGSVTERAADGSPVFASGIGQDISARKAAEDARAATAEQLAAAKAEADRRGEEEQVLVNLLRLALDDTDMPTFLDEALQQLLTSLPWLQRACAASVRAELEGSADPLYVRFERDAGAPRVAGTTPWRTALNDGGRSLGEIVIELGPQQRLAPREEAFLQRVVSKIVSGMRHREAARSLREAAIAANSASIAKSQFLATMSHEIRTPMNGVIGMLDLLLQTELDGPQRECAGTAYESANTLLRILNEVLDFSRLEAGQVKLEQVSFDPRHLMQRVLSLHRSIADEKGLALACEIDDALPAWLVGDPMRLRQVLINLLGNALKFTDSGTVTIVAHYVGGRLQVEVRDTGIGIPETEQARLFQRFVQADSSITRRYGGTGLGLAICRKLITAMGGEIGVTSRVHAGSTFWFDVPMLEGKLPQPTALRDRIVAAPPPPPPPHARLRLLVAEDNAVNQRIMKAFLDSAGHEVTVVDDGAQALKAHRDTPFDVILMDVQMPVLDGLSATRAIRALRGRPADVPIIAITANAMPGDRELYLAAGMDDYVSKPINRHSLYGAIEHARARVAYLNAASDAIAP